MGGQDYIGTILLLSKEIQNGNKTNNYQMYLPQAAY